MSEGNHYFVSWLHSNGVHKLWLDKKPNICASSKVLEEAKESLYEQICDIYGDGEAHIELIAVNKVEEDKWFALEPLEDAWLNNEKDIYSKKVCECCGFPLEGRNSICLDSGTKLKFGIGYFSNTRPRIYYYSEELLKQLSSITGIVFDTRRILYKGEKSGYVELLNTPSANFRLVKGIAPNAKLRTTFVCNSCNRNSYEILGEGKAFAYEELNPKGGTVAKLSSLHHSQLLCSAHVISKIDRKRRLYKFSAEEFSVRNLEDLYIPIELELPKIDSIDWG